jgi:hypothetical protein
MLRIICFAEASADARIGSELGDRVMAEEGPDWVEPDLLDALRYWTGLDTAEPFTAWTTLKRVGRQRGRPRYIGHRTRTVPPCTGL